MAVIPQLPRISGSDLRIAFPEIFRADGVAGSGTAVVRASSVAAARLAPAWPELSFAGGRRAPRLVMDGGSVPFGVAVAPGLLRAPSTGDGPWASSTIAAAWLGGRRFPGLGERMMADDTTEFGEAIAHAVVTDRLGGGPTRALPAEAARALVHAAVLIEGPDLDADLLALGALQGRKAAVLVRMPGGRLARAARASGVAVVALAGLAPWAVLDVAETVQGPAAHDLVVLAGLAGRGGAGAAPGRVAAAFLIQGTRYVDPATGQALDCAAFIDRMLAWRSLRARVPAIACFAGISFWKRRRMAEFAGGPVGFASTASHAVAIAAAAGGGIAVWPSRAPAGLDVAAAAAGVPVFRVEDGFVRSRGLGADFIPPASVILDGRGIYYDARQPSDLEAILATDAFAPDLLDRARRLREGLVARRITKYNLGGARPALSLPSGRRSILVPGQVADDLSVRTGGAGVAPGLQLLQAVRAGNPDAFILYKPHPDVEAGHRPGAVPDAAVLAIADRVVRDAAMDALIDGVDEVHTVTSLAGFEALLRGRAVATYGRPFYAGWGLTTDVHPPAGRTRRLTLDQLVAGTLILYPHYIDPLTGLLCTPEQLIDRLDAPPARRPGALVALRRGQGALRRTAQTLLARLLRRDGAKRAHRMAELA